MDTTKVVIYIPADTIGRGSDELGAVLMRNFLYTVQETMTPWRIIFINSGVKLAAQGSAVTAVLKDMEAKGTEILSCGTCLDYFGLKTSLVAGRISNMAEILASLTEATKTVSP